MRSSQVGRCWSEEKGNLGRKSRFWVSEINRFVISVFCFWAIFFSQNKTPNTKTFVVSINKRDFRHFFK